MATMKGFTIERAGLTSNEMFYSSLINDLCRNGAFTPVFTNTGGALTSNTTKATLEFVGDILAETQPWRLHIDGTVADPDTPGTGGQLVVGTAIQLPNTGRCFTLDGTEVDSEVNPLIAGKLGVTKSVVSGFNPLPDMYSLTMRVSGGVINMGGRIIYVRDNDPNLLHDYETNTTTYVGMDTEGNIVYDTDPSAIFLLLFSVHTNTDGVYDVTYSDINWQALSFVEPLAMNQATPFSYRLVVTSRGICIETWQNANFAERYYSWVCVQRLVDPLSGKPLDTGHSPVVATYSFSNNNKPYLYEMITSSILKIVVREHDVMCPSRPTVVSNNSDYVNAMFNPMKQVATSESNQYYIIFPSGMNTQRHLYNEEMDLIAYTSAGVISQWNEASVNVYGEASVSIEDIIDISVFTKDTKVTWLDISPSYPAGILSCAFIKDVVLDEVDPTKATLNLYELNGTFKTGSTEKLKIGGADVATISSDSKLTNRKYKGGSANYGTAEGMRIMFMIDGYGIEENFGIVIGDSLIPETPVNIEAIQDEFTNDVIVNWDLPEVSAKATSFNVYRGLTPDFTIASVTADEDKQLGVLPIAGLSGGSVTFTGHLRDKTYYYSINAVGPEGSSLASAPLALYIEDRTKPQDIEVVAGNWSNTIMWTPVLDAVKYSVIWNVVDGVGAVVDSGIIADIADTPFVHGSSAVDDVSEHLRVSPYVYTYRVVSFVGGTAIESLPSEPASATAEDPTVINAFTVTADAAGFANSLTWDDVDGATSYNLYWSDATIASKGLATKISVIGDSSYRHTPLTAGKEYFYKVEAVFASGITGTLSGEVSSTPSDPAQPQNISEVVSGDMVTITWDPVAGATSYKLYYDTADTPIPGVSASDSTSPPNRSITFTRPSSDLPGTTYNFLVTTVTASGESIPSTKVTATLD